MIKSDIWGVTVGFNTPKLFTKYFKEEFGMSPRDYQRKNSPISQP